MIIILLFLAVISCFLIFRGFALAVVWWVEGGLNWVLTHYETWWEGVRMPILLGVGILCAGFFVFSVIMGFLAHKREVNRGHR